MDPPRRRARTGRARARDGAAIWTPVSSVGSQVSFADVRVIVARRCAGCHSSAPTTPGIPAAPLGVLLDTPDEIRANAPRILSVAVDAQTMPLGNLTGMTPEERDRVGRWIRAGALLR